MLGVITLAALVMATPASPVASEQFDPGLNRPLSPKEVRWAHLPAPEEVHEAYPLDASFLSAI